MKSNGFTMIEIVVILAIITALSVVVLFSFTGFNEGAAINRSVRELSLTLRRAQNMSLSVTQITIGIPAIPRIPPAVGIMLVKNQSSYFLFADLEPRDNKYTDSSEKIGNDEIMERNIKISSITDDKGTEYNSINIIFVAPEAVVLLSNDIGTDLTKAIPPINTINIKLATPSGQLNKTISVRTSGQINIK